MHCARQECHCTKPPGLSQSLNGAITRYLVYSRRYSPTNHTTLYDEQAENSTLSVVKSPFLTSGVNDMCSKKLQNKEIPQSWTTSLGGVVANPPVHSRWYLLSHTGFYNEEVGNCILSAVIPSPSLAIIDDICLLVSCRAIGLVRPIGVSQ
jgi:hypothetical protein